MKFNTGEVVYFESWVGMICLGVIAGFVESDQVYLVNSKNFVDRKGNNIGNCFKHSFHRIKEEKIFKTIEQAFEESNKRFQKYCSEINTVEDLIKFPLDHCIFGYDYTDYEAVRAYKFRAHVLTGVDLKNDDDDET